MKILEASACENPVVVSNIGGLPEVVDEGKTGFIIAQGNPIETAKALEKLILDKELKSKLGKAGRQWVREFFDWEKSIYEMIDIYKNTTEKNKYC